VVWWRLIDSYSGGGEVKPLFIIYSAVSGLTFILLFNKFFRCKDSLTKLYDGASNIISEPRAANLRPAS